MFKNRNLAWLIIVLALLATACEASTMAGIRGPAKIHFGCTLSEDGLSILDETNQFHLTDPIVTLVDLGIPFPRAGLEEMISRMEPRGEYVMHKEPIDVPPGAGSIMNADFKPWVISLLGPGHYKVRIIQGDTVLAEGDFELIE